MMMINMVQTKKPKSGKRFVGINRNAPEMAISRELENNRQKNDLMEGMGVSLLRLSVIGYQLIKAAELCSHLLLVEGCCAGSFHAGKCVLVLNKMNVGIHFKISALVEQLKMICLFLFLVGVLFVVFLFLVLYRTRLGIRLL
jgi:hypothetical protein